MFKCKECGSEFDNKPDYCDCGNDTFEEIISEIKAQEEKPQRPAEEKRAILEGDSELKKNMPSIIFLLICIILSFIIIFFVANPKEEPKKEIENKKSEKINLPEIDTFWNNAKPKVQQVKTEPKTEENKEEKIAKVELKKEPIIRIPIIQNTPKKVQQPKTQTVKPQTQTVQKQTSQPKMQTVKSQTQTTPKQQTQTVQKQTSQPKTQTVKPQTQTAQKPTSQPVQNTTTQTQTKPAQTQTTQQSTPITVQTNTQTQTANKEELKQYKKALRNKIASNINFLNVAGDGKCTLSFSVSSSGTLLNRKFTSQSQNISLNDAVYSAMMNVSSFKAPPAGYKGETMKLTVQISGGNFSVSLE